MLGEREVAVDEEYGGVPGRIDICRESDDDSAGAQAPRASIANVIQDVPHDCGVWERMHDDEDQGMISS